MSVLVVTEQQNGAWHRMTWETLAAGQQIASVLGVRPSAVVLGSPVDALASELRAKSLDRVYVLDHELLTHYTPDGYALALRQLIEQVTPSLVLFPHTYQVRDFGPKLAASLSKPFLSDVVAVRQEQGELIIVRPFFQGKLQADVVPNSEPPHFVSLQAGTFRADQVALAESAAQVEKATVSLEATQIRTTPRERFQESKAEVDLASAEIIVAVGRGVREADHISLAKQLAETLGAELGASRPVCDNGWLPLERQVGSSGQTVSPKLYIALGISGAIQHVVGMKGAGTIVAINKDPSAPIFEIADYGIVADLFEVVPALTKAIKEGH